MSNMFRMRKSMAAVLRWRYTLEHNFFWAYYISERFKLTKIFQFETLCYIWEARICELIIFSSSFRAAQKRRACKKIQLFIVASIAKRLVAQKSASHKL